MSMAPTLNSCAPAPVVMSTAAATKMAAVTNTKISLTMVVIIVLLRYARWTGNACRETIRPDYGRCSPRLRLPPDVIAATASQRDAKKTGPTTKQPGHASFTICSTPDGHTDAALAMTSSLFRFPSDASKPRFSTIQSISRLIAMANRSTVSKGGVCVCVSCKAGCCRRLFIHHVFSRSSCRSASSRRRRQYR